MDNSEIDKRKQVLSKTKVDLLRDYGVDDINKKDAMGVTLLQRAINDSKIDTVKVLMEMGADVTLSCDDTILHNTILANNALMMSVILKNVPRNKLKNFVNMKTKHDMFTALHYAGQYGSFEHVVLLLEFGANFETSNRYGRKPIDLARFKPDILPLLQLIEQSFAMAKRGDKQLFYILQSCEPHLFVALSNCRNNEGRTIMQVLLMNKREGLARDFLWLRASKTVGIRGIHDRIDTLAERVKAFQDFWSTNCPGSFAKLRKLFGEDAMKDESNMADTVKIWCDALEKVHDVLLAFQEFQSNTMKSMTNNGPLKAIEETLEILGFDVEELYDITADKACYYEKLSARWKTNIHSLAYLMENIIYESIRFFECSLNTIRLMTAVTDDNTNEVQSILATGNVREGIVDTTSNRSALCYAAEKGNKKIVRLLLESGVVQVMRNNAISPIYLAAKEGHAKIVKIILKSVGAKDISDIIDSGMIVGSTALHAAAEKGHVDIVKILLSFGATYSIRDRKNRTPMDVSSSQDVRHFLSLVDEYFSKVKESDVQLIHELKSMKNDQFLAITGARNLDGLTLATVAAKVGAKNIAVVIFRMIKEARESEQL